MKTIPEIRQALASAVDEVKAASGEITEAKAKVKTAESSLTKADDKGKEAAQKAVDEAKAAAGAAVESYDAKKAAVTELKADLERAQEVEEMAAVSATVREAPAGTLAPAQVRSESDQQHAKMAPVYRMLADMIESHTRGAVTAEKWLTMAYGEHVAGIVKATHQLTDYGTGGALSLPDFAATIIEGLENMTVVRRMQPQVLTVPGALVLPREVSAPDGSWMSENNSPTPGTFAFGDIRLDPKRLAVEVVISRRLLDVAARGGAAVRNLESYVVRRLRERLAVNEDAGFLRGAGTEHVPLGIRNQIAAGNAKAIAGSSAANIETDLRSRVTKLQEANIMITAGYWTMPPRTRAYLADLRDANGNKIYPSIDNNNTLLGYPILMTNQVPTNLGGGSETEIMFGNGPSILVANGSDAEVRVSIEGSYQSGSTHYSLIQRNEMLIHMELYADVKLERDTAFSVLTGVTY
ncbi:MAG: phage major capsid protein [Thalassobaculum sp.]